MYQTKHIDNIQVQYMREPVFYCARVGTPLYLHRNSTKDNTKIVLQEKRRIPLLPVPPEAPPVQKTFI